MSVYVFIYDKKNILNYKIQHMIFDVRFIYEKDGSIN